MIAIRPDRHDRSSYRSRVKYLASGAVLIDGGMALAVVALRSGEVGTLQQRVEGALPTVVLAVLIVSPSIVGLAALYLRAAPSVLLAAAVGSVELGAVVLSFQTPALILGGGLLLYAYRLGRQDVAKGYVPTWFVTLFFALGLLVSAGVLFTGKSPYSGRLNGLQESGDGLSRSDAQIALALLIACACLTILLGKLRAYHVNRRG